MRCVYPVLILLVISCVPDFNPKYEERGIVSSATLHDATVELYHYTAAYGDSPFYVVMQRGKLFDTICLTTNATSLWAKDSTTIGIGFYRSPAFFDSLITIPSSFKGYSIEVDTTIRLDPNKPL